MDSKVTNFIEPLLSSDALQISLSMRYKAVKIIWLWYQIIKLRINNRAMRLWLSGMHIHYIVNIQTESFDRNMANSADTREQAEAHWRRQRLMEQEAGSRDWFADRFISWDGPSWTNTHRMDTLVSRGPVRIAYCTAGSQRSAHVNMPLLGVVRLDQLVAMVTRI